MRRRRGRSHVVRFPTAAFIHNPAHQCAGCDAWKRAAPRAPVRENRAPVRETPRTSARRTYIEPGTRNPAADTGAHAPLSRDERRRLIEDGRKQAHG
jgi:hypothetical protein